MVKSRRRNQMGAWSSSLYGNDITCDVRDTYMKYLQDQLSNQEAYSKTIEMFSGIEDNSDDAPLFWYALAETQWKTGRLLPEVKLKALEWIDKKGGMELWEESKSGGASWQKTLNKLKEKLMSEQPKEKKIRKPVLINQNPWNLGDVYAYRFHCEKAKEHGYYGKYMVLQKAGEVLAGDEIFMQIQVFDKMFDELPTLADIKNVRLLPLEYLPLKKMPDGFVDPEPYKILSMNYQIYAHKKKDYPVEHLLYLGNVPLIANKILNYSYRMPWTWAGFFIDWYQIWQGIEYETHEEGVFKYTYPE